MASMNLYPRSFLRLILLGWLLTALPLLVAIAFSSVSFSRLITRSEIALQETAEATRLAWELEEDLLKMERILRQHEVLRDPSLLDDYAATRSEWLSYNTGLASIPMMASLAGKLEELRAREAIVQEMIAARNPDYSLLRSTFNELNHLTAGIIAQVGKLADIERQAFRLETEIFQQRMQIALGVAFLLAGGMFWLGRRIVARLFNGVERAVIALGNNLLDRRIRLKGTDDLRWIGNRLEWLRRRMLSLENERKRVLRHVSHELKTPLAALREGASLLGEGLAGPLTPQQERIAGIMQGNTLRLQKLIDGLLRLQQAEYFREQIDPVTLRLDEMVQQVLATHKLAARDKSVRVSGTLAPLSVKGGREEVTTIIDNLLSNAIKFSPPQGTIRIQLASDDDKFALLDIIDSGPGVPESETEMIFEPFYRSADTKSVAGVGLGLAIAREFAMAQHGTLDLMPGKGGAHFRATFPLATGLT